MLKNYLLVALRNLINNRVYSAINIVGFAIGLAVSLLIALVVIDDLSYDRFHHDPDNLYRFITRNRATHNVNAITSGALTREVAKSVPGVVATTRVFNFGQLTLNNFGAGESEAGIQRFVIGTDSSFFKVFPAFQLLEGDPANQLREPNTALVTRDVARALFGDEPAIGQTVQGPDQHGPPIKITGIVSDCPNNSHIRYDIILPALVTPRNAVWWESWNNIAGHGYLRAQPGVPEETLEQQIERVGTLNGLNEQYQPQLQPILDVHLGSTGVRFDVLNNGKSDRTQVVMLSGIALLTLVIASINFINLSSARAIKRAREVGMRKVVGANRRQIMSQYLGESVLLTLIAMLIAASAVELALPALTNFINKEPTFTLANTPVLIPILLAFTILIGLLAGIYPSMVLAGFSPLTVLKGHFRSSKQGIVMRQVLVVVQYAISIALIASVIIVLQQLKYVENMDVGYKMEQTLVTFTFNEQLAQGRDALMTEFRKIPSVEAVGSSLDMLAFGPWGRMEGRGEDSPSNSNDISFYRCRVGENFIPALGLQILAGRNFSRAMSSDSANSVILNETAVRQLGWEQDPIGRRVIINYESGVEEYRTVVGVVNDFMVTHAREPIEPVCMEFQPQGGGFVAVRIQPGTIEPTLEQLRTTWAQVYPESPPFNSVFLDDRFNRQYQNDRSFATKIGVFSTLAIIIASLGLLGLSSYTAEQRRREIAIRKVLGSGESRILTLLTGDTVKWVLIANLVGWPLAYVAMRRWLEEFVFRTAITPSPFLAAGAAALVIAIATVSFQAWRAAITNPTRLLRQE